jgi:serine protease Do
MKRMLLMMSLLLFLGNLVFAEGFPAVKVYKGTSKAVVLIVAQKDKKSSMIGAGSIISSSGYVVTNAHVVIDKATKRPYPAIRVFIKPVEVTGDLQRDLVNRHKASVASYDIDLDLAVLKVDGLSADHNLIELADPDEIDIGEEVVAIGHPEQGGLWSLTYGRISGQISDQSNIPGKDVFQTDTSVNRGNSGGPLLDRRGYMVGINTNIARLGAGNMPITGVNFAVKSSVVRKWLAGKGLVLAYGDAPLHEEVKPVTVDAVEKPAIDVEPERSDEEKNEIIETKEKDVEQTLEEVKPESEIKPVEKKKLEKAIDEKKSIKEKKQELLEDEKMATSDTPDDMTEDRILTPKRPYAIDDLFKQVEREMEDIMEEMRWKIRKK